MKNYKFVCQLDSEGFYVGDSIADADPLRDDSFILAKNALDVDPPPRKANQHEAIRWTGTDWEYVPNYSQNILYSIVDGLPLSAKRGQSLVELDATLLKPEPGQLWDEQSQCWTWTLEQLKQMKLAELASLRWQVQCAGVMVGCAEFASSPDDAARLKSAIEDAQLIAEDVVAFKTKNFFLEISIDDLQEAYKKIVRHTQACYRNEKHLASQVNALTEKEDVQVFNLANGWPI